MQVYHVTAQPLAYRLPRLAVVIQRDVTAVGGLQTGETAPPAAFTVRARAASPLRKRPGRSNCSAAYSNNPRRARFRAQRRCAGFRHSALHDEANCFILLDPDRARVEPGAVITTGGTGITGRDCTPEAVSVLFDKQIDGFGEVFRAVSYEEIHTSTIQSRAVAGVANATFIFCLPGSTGACRTGWGKLISHQLEFTARAPATWWNSCRGCWRGGSPLW